MMRPLWLTLWISLVLALLLGFIGQAVDSGALYLLSGISFLVAIGLGIALMPIVRRLPWPPAMANLFPKISRGDRLDPFTGSRR